MKFYKNDLIKLVSKETGFYKNEIEEVFNSIIHNIPKMMDSGDKLFIKEFGSFTCDKTKERYGRNPKTNEKVFIPSRKKLKFKASEVLYNEY